MSAQPQNVFWEAARLVAPTFVDFEDLAELCVFWRLLRILKEICFGRAPRAVYEHVKPTLSHDNCFIR